MTRKLFGTDGVRGTANTSRGNFKGLALASAISRAACAFSATRLAWPSFCCASTRVGSRWASSSPSSTSRLNTSLGGSSTTTSQRSVFLRI